MTTPPRKEKSKSKLFRTPRILRRCLTDTPGTSGSIDFTHQCQKYYQSRSKERTRATFATQHQLRRLNKMANQEDEFFEKHNRIKLSDIDENV